MELRAEGLWKSYGGEAVLSDLSFTAREGVTWVTGPSGAGKTTLTRLLLGLEKPDRGSVSGGEGARFSAVFQEDRLLEGKTAEGNLRFVLGPSYDGGAVRALLEELGLGGREEKAVRALSGGMRRRVALARALCVPFDVLILDEPFAGLDGGNRERCLAAVLRRSAGKIVVIAGHEAGAGAVVRVGKENG